MKKIIFTLLAIAAISCSKTDDGAKAPEEEFFIKAADASFIPEISSKGILTKNTAGQAEDMLVTLKNAGVNTIRIRVWHNPPTGRSGMNEVKALAQEVKSKGMKVWLTVHYSDTWADPGAQSVPAEWAGLTYEALKGKVYNYTKAIVNEIDPDYIQIGNEINGGFLWPQGSYENMDQFKGLLSEGIRAVRETSGKARIMLHYAGHENAASFYANVAALDYDIIGLSYYPIWHGKDLAALQSNINSLGSQFDKDVVIAETSYPFTFEWNDFTNNIIGSQDQILQAYPATPQGQKEYLMRIRQIMRDAPRGIGFCYWGGDYIAFNGPEAQNGSPYENQAFWDFDNKALMVPDAFAD